MLHSTAQFTAGLAEAVIGSREVPPGVALNVNAPNRATGMVCWTRLGPRMYRGNVQRRVILRGAPYYWIGNAVEDEADVPGTDSHAMAACMISVTPIRLDWNAALIPPLPLDVAGFSRVTVET